MVFALLVVLGLVFGSFVNAFVWRLHEQERLKSKSKRGGATKEQLEKLSITKGRSICPHCGHELAAKDLIPVLSWLWLHGKCRYCGKPILVQYPLVEVCTGLLFVASYLVWPLSFHGAGLFQFVLWLVFLVAFMALAVYDLRWFTLPDPIVFPLVALALVQVVVVVAWNHDWALLWQATLGATIISGLFYFLFQVSKGGWIGGGDVKLGLVLGLLAGSPLRALLVIFFASVYGTLASLPLLVKSKQNWQAKVPFGPFLLLASFTVELWGVHLADWYTKTLL